MSEDELNDFKQYIKQFKTYDVLEKLFMYSMKIYNRSKLGFKLNNKLNVKKK